MAFKQNKYECTMDQKLYYIQQANDVAQKFQLCQSKRILLEKQFYPISSQSGLKQRSLWLFWTAPPQKEQEQQDE